MKSVGIYALIIYNLKFISNNASTLETQTNWRSLYWLSESVWLNWVECLAKKIETFRFVLRIIVPICKKIFRKIQYIKCIFSCLWNSSRVEFRIYSHAVAPNMFGDFDVFKTKSAHVFEVTLEARGQWIESCKSLHWWSLAGLQL